MSFKSTAALAMQDYESTVPGSNHFHTSEEKSLTIVEISEALHRVSLLTPPLWTLRDIVAVNPFLGYSDKSILESHRIIQSRLGAQVLPTLKDMAHFFSKGAFTSVHIQKALSEKTIFPSQVKSTKHLSLEEIISALKGSQSGNEHIENAENLFTTLAQHLDRSLAHPGKWQSDIIVDISRFCSSRFDQGVARLSCFKGEGLFKTWRTYATNSRGMYARGLKGFHTSIKQLPYDASLAVTSMLKELNIQSGAVAEDYMAALLGELPGWGGFLRQQAWQDSHGSSGELPELIAIRMAYDVALYKDKSFGAKLKSSVEKFSKPPKKLLSDDKRQAIRYTLLRASEIAYLESVKNKFIAVDAQKSVQSSNVRAHAQVVFCIDVRSEVLRRHLGNTSSDIQTYGFAGFFGLAIQMTDSEGNNQPQCPVLLQPKINVKSRKTKFNFATHHIKQLLQNFSRSAMSCFTYVETIGFLSFFQMLKEVIALPWSNSAQPGEDSPNELYTIEKIEHHDRVNLAKGILKNLGLKAPYARVVLLCGHDSHAENNPQAAALACGACAGHGGAPNAYIAANLLNDEKIRRDLSRDGFSIPSDTVFVAAIHNTMTDEIGILSTVPSTHTDDMHSLRLNLQTASEMVRKERAGRLGISKEDCLSERLYFSLLRRGKDISEVRPEWALAGNACFIAAKTEDIRNINLEGRSFLHNYDRLLDTEGSVLETILTAPVVVASWINLQYFASSVDPEHFGSGTKTIHNIAAGIGVLCGNDGDLAAGLSLQSVHDGVQLQHQPLRLQVMIQAPASALDNIIAKHSFLRDLIKNEWLLLYTLDDSLREVRRWVGDREWELQNYDSSLL